MIAWLAKNAIKTAGSISKNVTTAYTAIFAQARAIAWARPSCWHGSSGRVLTGDHEYAEHPDAS